MLQKEKITVPPIIKAPAVPFEEASGAIPYNMTNDYMFRIVLQENETVLRGLVAALIHQDPESIQTKITNPVLLGNTIGKKDFILDVNVLINNETSMNLEMQVINEHDWTDRSLNYLCRNYTKLIKGDNYFLAKPVIQIGFLNFDLFPKEPEFYATYRMENVKSHSLYSSKLQIGVVELNRIDIATDEDKAYKIDQWARLFKMKDWKGLKAMVKDNKYLEEAAKTIYYLNSDEHIQAVCERRAEVEAEERRQKKIEADYETIKIDFNNVKAENNTIKAENSNIKAENNNIKAENNNIKAENLKQCKEIEELKAQLAALKK